ncbi:GFA family protein [Marinilactibacillus psychrotolerans]|uniref:GFA family protein n=2 Tax=Marinilactibacillus psychrotolerans TaxID=191770 RepID=A0A5R9C125_9LACT|nr:GFA family protein [Marinilactibacillus psychrotolerans]TLQ06375.1 GFA family protein [Marinilactibacillus psychrotolerans]GEQ33905.1 aldehyde-activating protein [Marinilactibacillus psychrotolerans]
MENLQGQCLCGRTIITVSQITRDVTVCHCSMCRKQAAGPMFYTDRVPDNQIHFNQKETVGVYPSSKEIERGFCNQCGTFLFFRNTKQQMTSMNPELFDEQISALNFEKEIYYDDKPDYYVFANETVKRP